MKKTKLLSLLALIPMIVACGAIQDSTSGDNSTSNPSSEDTTSASDTSGTTSDDTSGSTSEDEPNWTDEELAVFQNHLYGYVLPYYEMEDNTVSYDSDDQLIIVEGAECTPEDLSAWAALMVADGFELLDDEDNYYLLKREVETETGTKYLAVQMAALDDDDYIADDGYGTFTLYMGDPYYYEWPADLIEQIVAYLDDESEAVVPAFTATHYEVSVSYLSYYGYAGIYCYTNSTTAEADYKATLEAANWVVADEKDSNGYYVAHSPDETIQIEFEYDSDYKDLDIFIMAYEAPQPWPTEQLAAIVNAWTNNSGTVIPAFVGYTTVELVTEYYGYDMYSLFGYYAMFVYTSNADAEDDYTEILEDAGYTVAYNEDDEFFHAISENEDLELKFAYDSGYQDLDIYFMPYVKPASEWPAEKIAAGLQILQPGTETVIPAFEAQQYVVEDEYVDYGILEIECTGFEDDAFEAYAAALTQAGWTVTPHPDYDDDYECISPDQDIYIDYYLYNNQVIFNINAYTAPSTSWPTEKVAQMVSEMGATGTVIAPNSDKITSFTTYSDGWGLGVTVEVTGDAEDIADAYEEQLAAAGWVVVDDAYGRDVYQDPNGTICIATYIYTDTRFSIDFYLGEPLEDEGDEGEFPSDKVNADLELVYGLSLGETPLPEGEEFTYTLVGGMYPTVTVTGGNKDNYIQALLNAGFVYDEDASSAYGCDSYKNESIEVYVYDEDDSGVYNVEFGAIYESWF